MTNDRCAELPNTSTSLQLDRAAADLGAKLAIRAVHTMATLAWPRWQRQQQASARASHYQRRGEVEHRPAPV
jgi:hypothetical protein